MRRRLFVRLRSLFRRLKDRESLERDLDEELSSYLALRTVQLVEGGMPADQARRAALLELGGVEQVKEKVRDIGDLDNYLGQRLIEGR